MLACRGFVALAPWLIAAVLVTPQLVRARYSTPETTSNVHRAANIDLLSVLGGDPGGGLIEDEVKDLYGNEVTAAVATYKVDAAGTLYELHSPQTELPHLASPKS
jgi:hypothetical protein